MDFKSGQPFWLIKNGVLKGYPSLNHDVRCEVAITGGGITGALVAYYLTRAGVGVVILDRREVGTGSTSASTGLLQYEVDTPLFKLIDLVGEKKAVKRYHLSIEAIDKIEELLREVGDNCGFERKQSLYLASCEEDVEDLRTEYGNEYLTTENRILKAQIKGRMLLTDAERATLADRSSGGPQGSPGSGHRGQTRHHSGLVSETDRQQV